MKLRAPVAALAAAIASAFAAQAEDRAFVDLPLPRPDFRPAAVTVGFSEPVPVASVRAVTLHLRAGGGWLAAQIPPEAARGVVRVPFGAFAPDGAGAGDASEADLLRVSLWWRDPAAGLSGDVASAVAGSAAFAPPAAVAVAGTGPGAERCARLLRRVGADFDRIRADAADADLSSVRLLFLPGAESVPPGVQSRLRAFVGAGGKLAVFYSGDPALASLVGLSPGTWEGGAWPGFAVAGSGGVVPHETGNRICPKPKRGCRVLAHWLDAAGRQTAAPAVVLAPRGVWFSHVPPRAYPAACGLFRAILSEFVPGFSSSGPEETPQRVRLPDGFKIAAWAAEPPRSVPDGVGTLFVRAPAKWFGDAPHPVGVALHAWLPCLADDSGNWLDPADPAVSEKLCRAAAECVRAGAAGVHLDYVRTAAGVPASEGAASAVTELVRRVSRAVKEAAPEAAVSAAVFPTPADAAAVNQDWPAWVREGAVDFVAPMAYADDPEVFRAMLSACLAAAPAAALVPGIGTGADESQADDRAAAEELAAAVSASCRGAAFFRLDPALPATLRAVLPSR